jgi:hypothetical protein
MLSVSPVLVGGALCVVYGVLPSSLRVLMGRVNKLMLWRAEASIRAFLYWSRLLQQPRASPLELLPECIISKIASHTR